MTKQEAIRDVVTLFCGSCPRIEVERISDLDDEAHFELQSFIASNLRLPWLTGIGVLDCIDMLVEEAICNGEKAFDEALPEFADAVALPKKTKRSKPAPAPAVDPVRELIATWRNQKGDKDFRYGAPYQLAADQLESALKRKGGQ